MTTKTGNTNISGTIIDTVEIPTAILGFSTMSSSNKVLPVEGPYCYFRLSVVVAITLTRHGRVQLETNTFIVLLLKLVAAFLHPSATRVRKNRSAIRTINA